MWPSQAFYITLSVINQSSIRKLVNWEAPPSGRQARETYDDVTSSIMTTTRWRRQLNSREIGPRFDFTLNFLFFTTPNLGPVNKEMLQCLTQHYLYGL